MEIDKNSIDIAALRGGIKNLAEQIREVKKRLRSTWTEPMKQAQWRHICLRHEITAHLILLATLRGRTHTAHRSEEWIEQNVAPLLERYSRNRATEAGHAEAPRPRLLQRLQWADPHVTLWEGKRV
jgi:hypothetical protein